MRHLRRGHVHDLCLVIAVAGAGSLTPASLVTGLCVLALAMGLQAWSKATLVRNSRLSTQGPYALCRHPFYLGNALMDLGLCIVSGNPWAVALCAPLVAVAYVPTIRTEESRLRAAFRDSHVRYCGTTPLIMPFGRRVLREWRSPVSWDNVLRERVLSRTVRHVGYVPLVVLASRVWRAEAGEPYLTDVILGAAFLLALVASKMTYRGLETAPRTTPLPRRAPDRL